MNVSVLISTYGEPSWEALARSRALPSAEREEPHEILMLHEDDATIAEVRNKNTVDATGDWFCFLDADDELGAGYLRAMRRAFEQRRGTGGVPPLLQPAVSYVLKGRPRAPRFLTGNLRTDNYLVVGTLVQRDLFMQVGGFSDYSHGFEDWSLFSKCWRAGAQVIQAKGAVYYAHVNPKSVHRTNWRNRKWQVEMHQKVESELDAWEASRA
jgi:cellulose synthase/poly-beta-1,6-N-acetylglucosamine synthase-like glycosyltransferase